MKRKQDPGIAWIREVPYKTSAEFDHDRKKLGEHYRELEKKYADRIVRDFKRVTDAVEASK